MSDVAELETIGRLKARRWTPADARRVVVIVHGHSEHSGRYIHVAEALAARGSVVVAPDLEGHGHSPGERGVITDFAPVVEDLHEVVQQVRGDLPVVMVAHSLGGLVATRYAQVHGAQLAGLVLSAPALGVAPIIDALLADEALRTGRTDPSILSRDPAVGEAYLADPLVFQGWRVPTLHAIKALDLEVAEGPSFADLPVLYVHGADDPLVPPAMAGAVIDRLSSINLTRILVPAGRHEVFNELDKEQTIDAVADFIGKVTA